MDTLVETKEYKGYKIHIHLDQSCREDSPRKWDNLGTMICFHSRYELGDEHNYRTHQDFLFGMTARFLPKSFDDGLYEWAWYNNLPEDMLDRIKEEFSKHFISLPLYLYDHSGITMKTSSFSSRWDSRRVGTIYVSKEDVRRKFSWPYITKKRIKEIEERLRNEVKTYDDYLTGNVYGYIIEKDEVEIDSCWGYYGDYEKYMLSQCKETIDYKENSKVSV